MADTKMDNRAFRENEELRVDGHVYEATWPGGEEAVIRLATQGKQPVRELIGCSSSEKSEIGSGWPLR